MGAPGAALHMTAANLVGAGWDLVDTVIQDTSAVIAARAAAGAGQRMDKESFTLGDQAYALNWAGYLALAASTPLALDMAALSTGLPTGSKSSGDATLAKVFAIRIENLDATNKITVGASGGASEFYDPFGYSGTKIDIPAGCTRCIYTKAAAGWAVGTRHILQIDPGANAIKALVAIGGA